MLDLVRLIRIGLAVWGYLLWRLLRSQVGKAVCCALIHWPPLMILDEPMTGVDPASRREFWDILYQALSEGTTIVVSTPYMDDAERCTRAAGTRAVNRSAAATPDVVSYSLNIIHTSLKETLIMKRTIPIFVTLALSGGVLADDAHHPEKQTPQTQAPQTSTPPKPAHESAPAAKDGAAPGMPMMQEHMKQMQEQMAKIRAEKDPVKREKMVQEQMNAMEEHMKMMQGMMGHGAAGGMAPHMKEKNMKQEKMDQMNQNKQQSMPMKQ